MVGLNITISCSKTSQKRVFTLDISQDFIERIVGHALREDPNECCGVLAGNNGVVSEMFEMTNTAHSPYRYEIDGKELLKVLQDLDEHRWDLIAIYHSHTHSPAYPSATDIRLATWPDANYLLVSLEDRWSPVIRSFRIVDGTVSEEFIRS